MSRRKQVMKRREIDMLLRGLENSTEGKIVTEMGRWDLEAK